MTALVEYANAKTPEQIEEARSLARRKIREAEHLRIEQRQAKERKQKLKTSQFVIQHAKLLKARKKKPKASYAKNALPQPKLADLSSLPAIGKGIFPSHPLYRPFREWLGERKPSKALTRKFIQEMRIGVQEVVQPTDIQTPFEKAWDALQPAMTGWECLNRIDTLSGIVPLREERTEKEQRDA